jgi:hypothetical protein
MLGVMRLVVRAVTSFVVSAERVPIRDPGGVPAVAR